MSSQRFLFRWSVRLLRREWRQQLGVLVLISAGVALSVGAIVAAFNLTEPPGRSYGTGSLAAGIAGDESSVVESLEAQGHVFGVMQSISVKSPGSANQVTVRSIDPGNAVTGPLLGILEGSWPKGADEIAVTDGVATSSRAVGGTVELGGRERRIVGVVENPTRLADEFVLTADIDSYGVVEKFKTTRIFVEGARRDITFPAGTSIALEDRGDGPASRTILAVIVSLVMAVTLLVVALMSGAALAVLARRRARQYGLLAAAGASPRQVRRAVTLTGFSAGLAAATAGTIAGLAVTWAVVPRFETTVGHRIDFAVPWWTVVPTVLLAVGATTFAVWWPARSLARQSVVEVLGSMRPRPSSAAGTTVFGSIGTVAGAGLLITGVRSLSATTVIVGICLAVLGLLLLAPGLIRLIGRRAKTLPLAGRMAGRSVARQQGRSAAFVAALALALAIPIGVALVTASLDRHNADRAPNLANDMAILWSPSIETGTRVIPTERDAAAIAAAEARLADVVEGASIAPIQVVVEPGAGPQIMELPEGGLASGIRTNFSFTPVDESCTVSCSVDTLGDRDANGNELLVTFRETWVANRALLDALEVTETTHPADRQAISRFADATLVSHRNQSVELTANVGVEPAIPTNTSIASTLILPDFAEANGWEVVTIGWLVVDEKPIAPDLLGELSKAGGKHLLVEAAVAPPSSAGIRAIAIAAGLAIGFGVVVAALSLLRSESADDLRVLQAIGAGPRHHRRFSAMIAGILTGAGSLMAIPLGSLAVVVLLADEGTDYELVIPWLSLVALLLLLPALAAGSGWLMSTTHSTNLGTRSS